MLKRGFWFAAVVVILVLSGLGVCSCASRDASMESLRPTLAESLAALDEVAAELLARRTAEAVPVEAPKEVAPAAAQKTETVMIVSPEDLPEFERLSKEGGVWVPIPPSVVETLRIAKVTPARFDAKRCGDPIVVFEFLKDTKGRWQALMGPYTVFEEDGRTMMRVGFNGYALAFDEERARRRYQERKFHRPDLSPEEAKQAEEVIDYLIARREEELAAEAAKK